jgi:acetyl esterase/lipase
MTSYLALTPDYPFPTQLRQANAALSYLLDKGISPANIVIGGDSAGGSLIMQLASHILHPLTSIPPPPVLGQALAGAVLISPWCLYSEEAPSYTRNNSKDLITARTYAFFTRYVRAGLTPESQYHCEPLSTPAEWWKGLDGVYARVLVTAGEYECPFDQIVEMSAVISHHVKDTTTVVDPGGVHEELIVRFAAGGGGFGKDYDAMVGFLFRSFQGGN